MNLIKNPIFIVGVDHSGTSLMISILSAHTKLYAVKNESYMFHDKSIFQYAESCSNKFSYWAKGKRWIEKTPVHIEYIQDILNYFENPKIIVMIRDGRDVVASLKSRFDFKKSLSLWIIRNSNIIKFQNHKNVLFVKLENLIRNTKEELKIICDFIGEDYEENLLYYYKTPKFWYHKKIEEVEYSKETHHQYRNWQINQPIFNHIGKYKKELTSDEIIYIEKNGDFLLKYFKYIKE